ncbi:MAG: hypothetical protein Q9169_008288 [Polycauliona sp. 2 TL-2023]
MSLGRVGQQAKRCLKNQFDYRHLGAFVPFTSNVELITKDSQNADERHNNGRPLSAIDGQLIAIKDNICTTEQPTTCASATLQSFHSPFSATIVEKLKAASAIVAGKTNLDEFGMGYGWILPLKPSLEIYFRQALGNVLRGSVRLPAAWTGTVGFKPSYGIVSRWGVVAYANSLDTVGILARTVETAEQVYDVIKGHDPRDPTTLSPLTRSRIRSQVTSQRRNKPFRIGIPCEYLLKELDPSIQNHWSLALQSLRKKGHSIHLISLPMTKSALAAYYVLAPAEASSNLAKYDGARYGNKAPHDRDKSNVLFSKTRGHNFGAEVRRRILLGSYMLSSTAIDNYFIRAQKVRRLVQDDFNKVFAMKHPLLQHQKEDSSSKSTEKDKGEETGVDIIIAPTSLSLPPLLSSLQSNEDNDATKQFQEDVYTRAGPTQGLAAGGVAGYGPVWG